MAAASLIAEVDLGQSEVLTRPRQSDPTPRPQRWMSRRSPTPNRRAAPCERKLPAQVIERPVRACCCMDMYPLWTCAADRPIARPDRAMAPANFMALDIQRHPRGGCIAAPHLHREVVQLHRVARHLELQVPCRTASAGVALPLRSLSFSYRPRRCLASCRPSSGCCCASELALVSVTVHASGNWR